MNKILCLSSIMLVLNISAVLGQSWAYSNILQGNGNITAISSTLDTENNVIVLGYFDGDVHSTSGQSVTTYGGNDFFLTKFDSEGKSLWIKNVGSRINDDVLGGVCASSNSNIYVAGGFQNDFLYTPSDSISSGGNYDTFLSMYTPEGDIDTCIHFATGTNMQRATSLKADEFGNLIIGGFFRDSISIMDDTTIYAPNNNVTMYFAKIVIDSWELVWANSVNTFGSVNGGRCYDIGIDNNSYYFTGTFKDSLAFGEDTIISLNSTIDAYVCKTDLDGNYQWVRTMKGDENEFIYSLAFDPDNNIYVPGYHNSNVLTVDSTETETTEIDLGSAQGFDYIILKYSSDGVLSWHRSAGGIYDDKLVNSAFYDGHLNVCGFFTDSLNWGGIILETNGPSDADMFVGALDSDGNFRSANGYGGTNNSTEDTRAIFSDGDKLYTVIRSNSELLQLGDSSYISTNGMYYVALGIIGCLPISVDNTIYNDVETCFGDSTGSIQISATGGFGSPWSYSIDNGSTSSTNPFHGELPAGDYQVVVVDAEGCAQIGPLVALTEPDTLEVQVVSTEDITEDHDGSIVVVAQGGSAPYTYWLQPDGAVQGFGTFTFATGDSGTYVVAVDDLNNCGPVTTDSLVIQEIVIPIDTTGFETLSGVKARVYPNPTTGNLTVEMPFDGRKCQMEVISMTGQVVLKRKVFSNGGVITETLDLSDQAKGMYMLRIDGQTLQSAIMVK